MFATSPAGKLAKTRIQHYITGYVVYLFLLLLLILSFTLIPGFGSAGNINNLLSKSSALGILAVGQTFVILAGCLDLSVGMLIGLIVVVTNGIMNGQSHMTIPALAAALAIGLAVGSVNGFILIKTRIHSLILTFGMLSVLQGVIFVITDRTIGAASAFFKYIGGGDLGFFPVSAFIMVVCGLIAHYVLRQTRFGRYVYAVGGSENNARRSGINTNKIIFIVYLISAFSAVLAGIIVSGRFSAGYPMAGAGYELDAIVAVVLGGTSLAGGRGGVIGTLSAVILLGIVGNILNLMSITSFVQQVIKGFIIIAAVAIYLQENR